MREAKYIEGQQATRNFEEGMKALFNVPKDAVVRAENKAKKKRASRALSLRKPKHSDRD